MRSKKVAAAQINGKNVDFYSPPHPELDLLWVNHLQLLRAFTSRAEANVLLENTRSFGGGAVSKAVTSGGRIVNIIPHPIAQAFCNAMDHANGHSDGSVVARGPAFEAYTDAAAKMAIRHWRMDVDDLVAAYHNAGGPFLRGKGVKASEGGAA